MSLKELGLVFEVKQYMSDLLKNRLHLTQIMSPLFVTAKSMINDHLNSDTRVVKFTAKDGTDYEVVQSTAKWKRQTIDDLDVPVGSGIVVDMRAIRCDEDLSNIHSYLVDQWDWEVRINKSDRSIETLREKALSVYECIRLTAEHYNKSITLPSSPLILSTKELAMKYPDLDDKSREHAICKEHGAIILTEVGYIHDRRAFDYDDWTMNADIIVWSDVLGHSIELSSMGVRVDSEAMIKQYEHVKLNTGPLEDLSPYHKYIMRDELSFTVGGGIGQSRLAMFILGYSDIKHVQP